jgi:trk system potassium uptake protein TrkA
VIIAQIAQRRFNVPKVIARILDPLRAEWYEKQGVHTICPTSVAIGMLEDEVREAAASGITNGGRRAPAGGVDHEDAEDA